MRLPTFLIIGAAKAGTTALFSYLTQHPQVYGSPVRETNFFALEGRGRAFNGIGDVQTVGRNSVTDWGAYCRLFEAAKTEQAVGEASPLYLYDASACDRIHQRLPDVKLIAILRNPVDRAYASFLHLRRDEREEKDDFAAALAAEAERIDAGWEHLWHYTRMGFYASQIARYLARFGSNSLRVYLYEDLCERPQWVLRDAFSFISVDDSFLPNMGRQPNRSGLPRSRMLQRLRSNATAFKSGIRRVVPERVLGPLVTRLERWNLSRPPMPAEVRASLMALYEVDISRLQGMIQRDLSPWLSLTPHESEVATRTV